MKYNVDLVVHFSYEIDAENISDAENKGIEAFYNDEYKYNLTPDIYAIDTCDDDGELLNTTYYY